MKGHFLNQMGGSVTSFLFWTALVALVGWLGWQLYQHPESFNPKTAGHHAYEDTQPQAQ